MNRSIKVALNYVPQRSFHSSSVLNKISVGRHKVTRNQSKPLTYEMAVKPHDIAHRKSWNSWNTTSLLDGLREPETVVEDMFIRRFMTGTWHNLFATEVIIKRQHNVIKIVGIVTADITPQKMYFLIGYCEELLSYWLKGPVKLELQVIKDKKDIVYQYI